MSRRIFKRERHVISFPSTRLSTRSWKGFGGNACLISIPMLSQTSPAGILHTLICVFLGYPAPMQNSEILACFCMRKYRFMTPFRDQRFNIGSVELWTPLERIWDMIKYEAAAEFKERTSSFAVMQTIETQLVNHWSKQCYDFEEPSPVSRFAAVDHPSGVGCRVLLGSASGPWVTRMTQLSSLIRMSKHSSVVL